MAITDNNYPLEPNVPVDILLGTSNSFIVQNTINSYCTYKVKNGNATIGGVLKPGIPYEFASDMTFESDQSAILYVMRG